MEMIKIIDIPVIKTISPIFVICKGGRGKIGKFNRELDRVYQYLYENELQKYIVGPSIGLFYSKTGGRFLACVPIKEKIKASSDFEMKIIPEIKAAVLVHKEKVELIDKSFEKIFEFIKRKSLSWNFPVREIYHVQKGGYLVEIQIPVYNPALNNIK